MLASENQENLLMTSIVNAIIGEQEIIQILYGL